MYFVSAWLRLLTPLVRTLSYDAPSYTIDTPSYTIPALCTLPPPRSHIDGGGRGSALYTLACV